MKTGLSLDDIEVQLTFPDSFPGLGRLSVRERATINNELSLEDLEREMASGGHKILNVKISDRAFWIDDATDVSIWANAFEAFEQKKDKLPLIQLLRLDHGPSKASAAFLVDLLIRHKMSDIIKETRLPPQSLVEALTVCRTRRRQVSRFVNRHVFPPRSRGRPRVPPYDFSTEMAIRLLGHEEYLSLGQTKERKELSRNEAIGLIVKDWPQYGEKFEGGEENCQNIWRLAEVLDGKHHDLRDRKSRFAMLLTGKLPPPATSKKKKRGD